VTVVQNTPIISSSRYAYKPGLLQDHIERHYSVVDGYCSKRSQALFELLAPALFCSQFLVVRHEVLVLNLTSTPYLALYPSDYRFTLPLSSALFLLICPPCTLNYSLFVVRGTRYKYYLSHVLFDLPPGSKSVVSNTGRHCLRP